MAQEEKSKKKNRLRYMILSVIIAIIAWALVTNITDPDITKTFSGIRTELSGEAELLDKGFVVTNRSDLPKMSVKMRGKRSDLIKALDRAKVVLDVSSIDDEGEFYVETTVKLPSSRITVERIGEQSVPVYVAELKTKEIPVRITQTGELKGKIVKSTPVTETVTIKGAETELDLIDAAEVVLDISTLSQSCKTELSYSLVLSDGADREDLTTLNIPENLVTIDNILYDEKELPVEIIVKGQSEYKLNTNDTRIEPKTIKVGIMSDSDIKSVTVTIDENAGEDDYKTDKNTELYIPANQRTIHIAPVWDKLAE